MADPPPTEVLSALPRTRPHRRSEKRAPAAASQPQPAAASGPKPPAGSKAQPAAASQPRPVPAPRAHILGTAAQAAAELAEIGLTAGARALRNALDHLPRP